MLLELKEVEAAVSAALEKAEEAEGAEDLVSPLARLHLPAAGATPPAVEAGPNTSRSLSPGAVERLNKLGNKLSEAETILQSATCSP